jgi:hypothetical protein
MTLIATRRFIVRPSVCVFVAIGRLFLDNIPHVKTHWPMVTPFLSQIARSFGCDDVEGTVVYERIYHEAGSKTQMHMPYSGLVELIASVLALNNGKLFKVLNLETPDPRCELREVLLDSVCHHLVTGSRPGPNEFQDLSDRAREHKPRQRQPSYPWCVRDNRQSNAAGGVRQLWSQHAPKPSLRCPHRSDRDAKPESLHVRTTQKKRQGR